MKTLSFLNFSLIKSRFVYGSGSLFLATAPPGPPAQNYNYYFKSSLYIIWNTEKLFL